MLRLAGPRDEIVIRRDRYGIPHIEAAGDEDAAFGLGFCQGQDRAFQLELLLRLSRGTLAQLVGREALPIDRLARRVGFVYGTTQQIAASAPELAVDLRAFARGVTAGARLGGTRRAHEFALLRAQPSAWVTADVMAVNRMIAFLIPSNWDAELARLKVLAADGPDALVAVERLGDTPLPVIGGGEAAVGEAVDALAADLRRFSLAAGIGGASNSWVVGGTRTASGRPLLANDPHLAPTLPSHWYLVHVETPGWRLAGACYAGTPAVLVGFNGYGAWGVTAGLSDTTDLYVERLDDTPVERRVERIEVRGSRPVVEQVLVTPNGPIVSPALHGVPYALSLRATWLEPRPVAGFLRSFKARTFEEFRGSFVQWPAVPLNVVWADVSGTIGWQLAGEVPRRRKGYGMVPGPGWEPSARWKDGTVPFDAMPFARDPDGSVIVTANNRPRADSDGPFLGADWIDGYRAARIHELLAACDAWDVPATLGIQLDLVSLPWHEIREAVLAAPAAGTAAQARDLLAAWDGELGAGSPAATVYVLLACELVLRALRAAAPHSADWPAGKGFHVLAPSTLYGRRRLAQLPAIVRRSSPDEIAGALAAAVATLSGRLGDDAAQWAWGRARPVVLRHPLGLRPPLDRVFDIGPLPMGGDGSTIAQAP
jgi:penicillin amidase